MSHQLRVVRPALVTQGMLERYMQLKELQKEAEELRQQILEMMQCGTPIERGPLTAEIRIIEKTMFTAANLTQVLGPAAVENLRRRVPKSTSMQLWVR